MDQLDEAAAWIGLRSFGREVAGRLSDGTGMAYDCPLRITHLRSTGACDAQPAHTDHPHPWLVHSDSPGMSMIVAVDEATVWVFAGSHRVFRRLRTLTVPRAEVGPPLRILLRPGRALLFRQDLIHHGGESSEDRDRAFFYINHSGEHINNTTGRVKLTE